ncbi:MAG TPA: hypothetical protein VK097_10190 [Lentibacillus sp.]|nr:hypothetical protein [Lentibacillus sp.]HLR62797.1 hypothetical protein [Lentibacillus sp.]
MFQIGDITIPNLVVLAPMAGVSDAFRLSDREGIWRPKELLGISCKV